MKTKSQTPPAAGLPKLSAPALRALASVGIASLSDLTHHTEAELTALHGLGPTGITQLRSALQASGLSFATSGHGIAAKAGPVPSESPTTGGLSFTTKLSGSSDGPTGIVVPETVISALGSGKKPAVLVNVSGYEYRSTVGVMGGKSMIPFSSAHRAASGVSAGDSIAVTLMLDVAPRTVEIPAELAAALAAAKGAQAAFDTSAPSRKKEMVRQVVETKSEETRARRIAKIIEQLRG